MVVLDGLRIVFGTIFILFLPGFVWSLVFFYKKKLGWIERMVLSFGLSIVIVPLAVFWLNWLFSVPITLRNTTIVACALIVIPALYLWVTRPSLRNDVIQRAKNLPCIGSSIYESRLQGRLESFLSSGNIRTVRRWLVKAADFVLAAELWWPLIFCAIVYSSYLFRWGSPVTWVALILAFLPFPLRRARHGRLKLRTPLDIPIAISLVGALVGLIVSPRLGTVSLGAFQCILATCFVYYSWINHADLAKLMRKLIPITLLAVLAYAIFVGVQASSPSSSECTYHGLALVLIVVAAIGMSVAIFSRGTGKRWVSGFICLALFGTALYIVEESVPRLLSWESVSGRTPRWEETVTLLKDHPFVGLGLGCWGIAYHGTDVLTHPTNVHNAYLELYSSTGFLGAAAFIIALVIGAKLGLDIIKAPRNHPWYGFGIGVLLACLAALLVGVVESSPVGVPMVGEESFRYLVSLAPLALFGFLVCAHRLILKPEESFDKGLLEADEP